MEKALNTANLLIEVKEIDLNLLKNLRRNYLQSLPDEFVRVYDLNNKAIYKDDAIKFMLSKETLDEVRLSGSIDFKRDDRQFVAIKYKDKFVIVASARNIYGEQELKNLAYVLFITNLIGIIIIYFAGRYFAKQALDPISKMIRDVDNIGEANLSSRLDEGKKKDELSQLAMTFNRLFTRVEDAFERQKKFVSNASHELRTPLTTITGEIEVALMKKRSQEQYEQVLMSVLEEAKTLTKLSNDLLKLTQTNEIQRLLLEEISVTEILQILVEDINKRNNERILITEYINGFENLFIYGNIELLKIALLNIIDNAFKFSDNKPVYLSINNKKKNIHFIIKDQGIGMNKDEMSFIFQPFYRSSKVSNIPGSGVGLSLTDKIIKLHGGKIKIISNPGKGTEVTTILPVNFSC